MCVSHELLYPYVSFGLTVPAKNWTESYGDFGDWGDSGIWKSNCLAGFPDAGVGFGSSESGCSESSVFFSSFTLATWNREVDCVVDMPLAVLSKSNSCFDLLPFFLEDTSFILFPFDWHVSCTSAIFFNNVTSWVTHEYAKFPYISHASNYWI